MAWWDYNNSITNDRPMGKFEYSCLHNDDDDGDDDDDSY